MTSETTNGHGPGEAFGEARAILYARVSTDEQARSGYSLAQQLEALRAYAAREGYEVLEEVVDPGQSGASLERPGMDRVRDLVASFAGGVSLVLAQDRDRIAREPAYHYLLRKEFEEYGTKIRALNDRGDESPEGELTDGILDQLAKFERAKTAERTRRGKLQKARSGKIVGGHPVNYGFKMNATRDAYEVDEPKMAVVRRIFRMIGEEGLAITAVAKALTEEGEPGPTGGRWNTMAVRSFVLEDVYKPHAPEEVQELVSPEVSALLERDRRYGIWWFNRERWRRSKVSEPSPTGEGRVYRSRVLSTPRPREEWVAVPVPDSGIPRQTVEAARHIVANNKPCSSGGERFWELSGGVLRCSECGRRMRTSTARKKAKTYFYYSCASRRDGRTLSSCTNSKGQSAERAEALVWNLVKELLTDPERLRAGLEEMINCEREGNRGDPERESRTWLEKLAEADRMRAGYQEQAAQGLMTLEELRARLEGLENTRESAHRELAAIREQSARLAELERDRDALMESYAGAVPEALERLEPEERHNVYRMLRLQVAARPDGALEASGIIVAGLRHAHEDGRPVRRLEGASWPRRVMSSSSSTSTGRTSAYCTNASPRA